MIQTNQESQVNNQNSKKSLKIAIFAVCLIGTILFVGIPSGKSNVQMPQLRLLQQTSTTSQVISSERNMTVCGGVFSSNKTVSQYSCSTYSTHQDMVARQNLDETLSVYVVYKSFEQFSEVDPHSQFSNDNLKMIPLKKDDLNIILKATVSSEGHMLSLERPAGTTPSELLVRLTERLIEQYFPNLNSTLYNFQDSEGSLLRSAEKSEEQQLNVEDSYLGKVSPTYTIAEKDDGTIEMHKSYTQNDFVHYEETAPTKIPEVAYDSKFIVEDGNVKENKEVLVFSLNQKDQAISLSSSSGSDDQSNELIGSINAKIESNFRLVSIGVNKTLTTFIKNYEKSTQFSVIDLTVPQNNVTKQAETKNLLSSSEILFSKDYKIFEMSILDNKFSLSVNMVTQEEQTTINSGIYLNNQTLVSIYNDSIEHKFIKCEDISKDNQQQKEYTVFKMTHKIYGGIVSIPVQVDIGLKYGWTFSQQMADTGICQVKFVPFAEPKIKGLAKVNFLSIGEAGIEAKGTVANTQVTFEANIDKKQLKANLAVNVMVQPYTYDVQLFYSVVKCSVSNFLSNLISFNFSLDSSCQAGDKTYMELAKGESTDIKRFAVLNQELSLTSFISSIYQSEDNNSNTNDQNSGEDYYDQYNQDNYDDNNQDWNNSSDYYDDQQSSYNYDDQYNGDYN